MKAGQFAELRDIKTNEGLARAVFGAEVLEHLCELVGRDAGALTMADWAEFIRELATADRQIKLATLEKTREQAEALRLKNSQDRNELIALGIVSQFMSRLVAQSRAILENLPHAIGDLVSETEIKVETEALVRGEIAKVCEDLARACERLGDFEDTGKLE